LQVQQIIGQQLPPPGTPMPPQMENQLAMMVAQAMQQLAPMYKSQPQVDPVIQTEQMRVAAMQEKAQIDAQTKVAVAQINSQARVEAEQVKAEIDKATIISDNANAEADRQNRLAIEAMKAGNV
jgi:hypothetical protein